MRCCGVIPERARRDWRSKAAPRKGIPTRRRQRLKKKCWRYGASIRVGAAHVEGTAGEAEPANRMARGQHHWRDTGSRRTHPTPCEAAEGGALSPAVSDGDRA